jgi:O-antigen ligase
MDIVVGYLLFEDGSYWFRRLIWQYGSATVSQNPVFGIGLNEWQRPAWMGNSIDNFWLFLAVRHGLPGVGLIVLAFLSIFLAVAFKRGLDERARSYRTGLLISLTGFFVVAWTVALWSAVYVLFLFLLGCGSWFLDVRQTEKTRVPRAFGPAGRTLR